jgi:tetratricopeptide (TPR) repeat protein
LRQITSWQIPILGDLSAAEAHARCALDLDGNSLEAWSALACIAERHGDYSKAIDVLESALKVFPDHADWLLHLGCTHMMAKQYDAAIGVLQHALQCRPQYVEAMNNLGQVLFELGRLEEAEAILRIAIDLRPEMKELYINLANVQISLQQHAEAKASFNQVFHHDPDNASAHFVLGMLLLVDGDFANGWREYAWRWQTKEYGSRLRDIPEPEWQGGDLAGKALFVLAEQGIGDTLQFVRYLPMISKLGGRVFLECQAPLKRLLGSLAGVDALMAKGEPLPKFDLHIPLLNIPGVMGTSLASIPNQVPYLHADAIASEHWEKRISSLDDGLKVGIAWAGNPDHANDRNRSMRLSQLAPLAAQQGVTWISLQKGVGAEQVQMEPKSLRLVDWTDDLTDFADTAALIENLDLVIAVDTSVVHLAGALNKPVWVMVPFTPDWRWLLDRPESPWYPSMRLFRQTKRDDWTTVVNRVAHELALLINPASSVRT